MRDVSNGRTCTWTCCASTHWDFKIDPSILLGKPGCSYIVLPRSSLILPKFIHKEKTRDFMQVCEKSGAEAITVHMRLREERPAEPAHWDEMARLWDAVKAAAPGCRRMRWYGCMVACTCLYLKLQNP